MREEGRNRDHKAEYGRHDRLRHALRQHDRLCAGGDVGRDAAERAEHSENGAEKANPVLLEPYVKVEVIVPEDYMGDVIGDLNSRRGRIDGMEPRNGAQVINAFVPLSEMFGYSTDLRSKTQGRGNYSMEVSYYDEVPKNIADAVTAKNKGE